jgi:uncharacterized protein (TIGR02284 family)
MAEMTKNPKVLAEHLNSLIELDFDAVEAYQAAIDRLSDPTDQAKLRQFMGDHERHITDLGPPVLELGGAPAQKPDIKKILAKGKVVLAGIVGDRAILVAMKSNEETSTRTYRKASSEEGLPSHVRAILEQNFADEQRHLAWIESRLSSDGPRVTTSR